MSLEELETLLRQRRIDPPAGSYSATLVSDPERASRKVLEEAYELCVELLRPVPNDQRVSEEAADLLFHLVAALVAVDVSLEAVLSVLDNRGSARRRHTSSTSSSDSGRRVT